MRTSESINELAEALSKAQAVMKHAIKDSNNPAFNSKYADLSSVWEVARKPLTDNGLCVIQMPIHTDDGKLHLTTRIAHKSGQWVEETMSIPVAKDNAHGYGSAITYCKRFMLSAATGIVSDVDDDGNAAVKSAADRIINHERPLSATQVMHDALAAMDVEEQNRIRDMAMDVIAAFGTDDASNALAVVTAFNLDHEQKLALGSLLPSKIRNGIKTARVNNDLATQP